MAKSKKRRKHKPQRPPLSGIDKFLYGVFALILIAFGLAFIVVCGAVVTPYIAITDESIVAFHNSFALPCSIPLGAFFAIGGIGLYTSGTTGRQPLFGNKKFKSKNDIPIEKVYPLFSKKYWKYMRKSEKSLIRTYILIIALIFLVCAVIAPFGFYPRHTLDKTNHIKEYNSFNSLKENYNFEEAEKLVIKILKTDTGRYSLSYNYSIAIEFVFENDNYTFKTGDFSDLDTEETLEYLLYIKSSFDKSRIEIRNTDMFYSLLGDWDYTAEEKALVYQLYDIKE